MFHVYVLHSEKDNGLYVGYTTNIKNRLNEHNEGSVISTKARRPLRLIFLESYINTKVTPYQESPADPQTSCEAATDGTKKAAGIIEQPRDVH